MKLPNSVRSAIISLLIALAAWLGYEAKTTNDTPPPVVDVPSVDTTSAPNPPNAGPQRHTIGVTAGLETVDHRARAFKLDSVPAFMRIYDYQDKVLPHGVAPRDWTYIAASQVNSSDPHRITRLSNFWRFRSMASDLPRTHFIMSTEIIYHSDGSAANFPNRNYRYSEWGTDEKIHEFVRAYIADRNEAIGIGRWQWQLSSEPWDPDFAPIMRAYIEAWLTVDPATRPQLVTPALPVGQSSASEADVNKWYGRHGTTLDDYLPADLRQHFTAVAMHAYPLDGLTWVNDTSLVLSQVRLVLAKAKEWGIDEVYITETAAPNSVHWQDSYYAKLFPALDELGIARTYLYNYRPQRIGAHFDECWIQNDDGALSNEWAIIDKVTQ